MQKKYIAVKKTRGRASRLYLFIAYYENFI